MDLADVTSNVTVGPNAGLVVWTAVAAATILCGLVTAAKGRWGWVLVGLVTGGLVFLYSAWISAAPGSVWAQRFRTPGVRLRPRGRSAS